MANRRTGGSLRLTAALVACTATGTAAFADAWGSASGYIDASVFTGANETLVWNTDPALWGLWSEAEVFHMHPPLLHDYALDVERLDHNGDGFTSVGPLAVGDLARVDHVEAAVATGGYLSLDYTAPYIDMSASHNVYSYAHDVPGSWSAASGLGQHDNVFRLDYTGGGDTPDSTSVTMELAGWWELEGDSDPDDNWWADWYAAIEVYDATTGEVLGSADEYQALAGPGYKIDAGAVYLELDLELQYGTAYAMRFWMDAESYAVARATVTQPGPLVALPGLGVLAVVGRRRR